MSKSLFPHSHSISIHAQCFHFCLNSTVENKERKSVLVCVYFMTSFDFSLRLTPQSFYSLYSSFDTPIHIQGIFLYRMGKQEYFAR